MQKTKSEEKKTELEQQKSKPLEQNQIMIKTRFDWNGTKMTNMINSYSHEIEVPVCDEIQDLGEPIQINWSETPIHQLSRHDQLRLADVVLKVGPIDLKQSLLKEKEVLDALKDIFGVIKVVHYHRSNGFDYLVLSPSGIRISSNLGPKKVFNLISEVDLILQQIHKKSYLHGDISPKNIITDANGKAHLIDFGLSFTKGSIF